MKKIVFATGNAGKMKEIREILADLPVEIYSMKEAGISVEIDENGKTFEENAKIKAQTVAGCTDGGTIVLADDSGLEVDALNGEPGVYSARYMGEDTSYRIKNQSLVDRLEGVPPSRMEQSVPPKERSREKSVTRNAGRTVLAMTRFSICRI